MFSVRQKMTQRERLSVAVREPEQDLLALAAAEFDAEQAAGIAARGEAIRAAFRERFGLEPEYLHLIRRWGVWTFKGGPLGWRAGDDGFGADHIWFTVIDAEGGAHEASSLKQLGGLVRRGVPFERLGGQS